MYVNYSSIANLPFVEKGSAPSTRESPEIHKEIQRLQVKKIIRERLIRVARCYPCFIFFDLWPSPKADGHYALTLESFSLPCHRVHGLRRGQIKEKTRISRT